MDVKTLTQSIFSPRTIAVMMNPAATAEQKLEILSSAIGVKFEVASSDSAEAHSALADLTAAVFIPGATALIATADADRWKGKKVRVLAVITEENSPKNGA